MTLRLALATTIALAALFATAGAADAHAALVATTPTPGSVLAASPPMIELHFSESVELPQQAVRLFDANRNEIDLPIARHGATNDVVVVAVPSLADGGYVVAWRAVSADGHPISAAFTFAVGHGSVGTDVAAALSQLAPRGASRESGVVFGLMRALAYGALATLLGAAFLAMRAWPAAFDDRRARRLMLGAGIIATLASALVYGFQGINTRGGRISDLATLDTWRDVASTHTGRWLLARTAMLAVTSMLVVVVARCRGAVRHRAMQALLGAGTLVVLCVAMSGHAAAGRHTTLGLVADAVHVAAMSLWIGGLVLVLFAVLPAASPDTARAVAARFSTVAFASVCALIATGSFLAWRQGLALRDPAATDYGTFLLIKVGFVAALVAIGARSRTVLRARSATTSADNAADETHADTRADWRTRIRRTIAAELVVGVAVFAMTSMLVNAAPRARPTPGRSRSAGRWPGSSWTPCSIRPRWARPICTCTSPTPPRSSRRSRRSR